MGNVPIEILDSKKLKRALVSQIGAFGEVQSIRFRSIAAGKSQDKRISYITKQTSNYKSSCNAYVVMKDSDNASQVATSLNGLVFEGRHLRFDLASKPLSKGENKKTVFVGNLPFDICEETLRKHFHDCGQVSNVRVVRDSKTGLGKGFAFVCFKERSSVSLATKLHGSTCQGRAIRIKKCSKIVQKK